MPSLNAFLQVTLLFASFLTQPARAQCECGYEVDGQIFTHKVANDFSKFPDTANLQDTNLLPDWELQNWAVPSQVNEGFANDTHQEILLPRKNEFKNIWIEDGKLVLRQVGYTQADEAAKKEVSVAEMVSKRRDIKYGTFRAKYSVETQPGANGGGVAGFFYYYSDDQETDIEILTNDGPEYVHYTQHPSYNETTKTVIPLTTAKEKLAKLANVSQEHRFDWFPESTTFYQDSVARKKIEKNTPSEPGQITFNMWANGGKWSGKPSDKDIHMRIDYIVFFFNTTENEAPGATKAFDLRCARHGWINSDALCHIPPAADAVTLAMMEFSAGRKLSFSSIGMLLIVSLATGLLV